MNNRKFDRIFSGSASLQIFATLVLTALFVGVAYVFLDGKHVLPSFLGSFDYEEEYWWIQTILAILGFFLFSILLSSIVTAWITNLSDNIRNGRRRYNFSNHVIIFGGGDQLSGILGSLGEERDIIVVSDSRPVVKQDNFVFYRGERDDRSIVEETLPARASVIYIIGEDNEPGHDSRSLKCLELLKEVTKDTDGAPIYCFIIFNDEETTEVFQYLKGDAGRLSSRLYLVDTINEYEYRSEQFLLGADFIPVIRKDSPKKAHFILCGTGKVTQAMAYTLCHACHYPNLDGKVRKTCITIVAPDAFEMRDMLLLARPHLFEESVYESIFVDGRSIVHRPQRDILDIEWRFVAGTMADASVCALMNEWACDGCLENRIVVCNMKSSEAIRSTLHLPVFVYGKIPVAVYLEDSAELIRNANRTAMYGGNISIFGPASDSLSDPLLRHRSECGQRVNYIYALAYSDESKRPGSPMDAWYSICEADKLSSIYCAIGLTLREKTFDMEKDIEEVYEAEHRRWMMSEFLMGFRYGPKRDKVLFTHNDLVPFKDLPVEEQDKDKILIDNRVYILTGEGEPNVSGA